MTADLKTQNVHVEIEQRWHQVETTPLREEKQVPIAPLHLSSSEDGSDRLSAHELTTLLEKEVMGRQVAGFCAAAFPSTHCTWWWPEWVSHIILRDMWPRPLKETDTQTDRFLEYSAGTRGMGGCHVMEGGREGAPGLSRRKRCLPCGGDTAI